MEYMDPFVSQIQPNGVIPSASKIVERKLSDMVGFYADADAEQALLAEDPIIYHVYYGWDVEEVPGQLNFCTTILYPGKVGDEFFMTKGHFHGKPDRAETYYGMQGEGHIMLMTPEGRIMVQKITPGVMAFVPPYWAHRTINSGTDNFVFLAVYPGDAGYNYGSIADTGFASILVERSGAPTVEPNPRYVRSS